MNVAIVGGRSLLKGDLSEALSDLNVTLRLDQKPSPESSNSGHIHNCDFQDIVDCEKFLSGIDCVIYTGLNWRGLKQNDIYNQIVDIGCIVNEALNNKTKIIFLSDALSMGYHPQAGPYDEAKAWNQSIEWSMPGFVYHLAEREIYRGISEGIEAVVVRSSFMLGAKAEKEEFLSHSTLSPTSKKSLKGIVNIVSRKDIIQMITKLIHLDKYDHRFVNCAGHSLSTIEFVDSIDIQKSDQNPVGYFAKLWAKFRRKNILPLLHRPDGLDIDYDNRRSIDWVGMEYSDLKSTLKEFQL